MIQRILPAIAVSLALAGCMSNVGPIGPLGGRSQHDIAAVQVAMPVALTRSVTVSVVDERPYVLSGEKSDQFVGTERGQWSQTNDIKTQSGLPLADDLTAVIADALAAAGAQVRPVPMPRGAGADAVRAAFQAEGTERLLVVRIHEWRTDSYTRVHLAWRLEAAVYDRDGNLLGRSSTGGKAPVGDTLSASDGNAITIAQLSRKLTNLLNEPQITKQLH